jgi:hypothetical protein
MTQGGANAMSLTEPEKRYDRHIGVGFDDVKGEILVGSGSTNCT